MQQKRKIGRLLLILASSLMACTTARAEFRGNLTVEVAGLQDQKGNVCIKVFSSSKGFPNSNEGAIKRQCTKITETPMTFSFNNLKSGSYAVAVYHDRNNNQQLDRNSLGMPTEGFGFSKNPVVRQAAPKFGDCLVLVAGQNTRVQIQMQYSAGG